MRNVYHIIALPACLIAVVFAAAEPSTSTACSSQIPWPYNLPRTVKYFPEHAEHIRREEVAAKRLTWQSPIGVKKMSGDPGEKFFLHDWSFDDEFSLQDPRSQVELHYNHTEKLDVQPAIGLHRMHKPVIEALLRRTLFARDFQCPTGTNACSALGASDLCCPTGQTCVETSGGVGCCPNGQTCGGSVAPCDTSAGYTSCPINGGCCIPGASCLDSGCVFYGTQTVTTTLAPATVTTTSSISSAVTSVSGYTTTVIVTGPGTTQTTTVVSPTTVVIAPTTSLASTTSASTCTSGFFSCPASLGGGCCPNGQGCASGTQCTSLSTTGSGTASAPVRGTSMASSSTSVPPSSSVSGVCPTGYYMCSAVYLGGCCQVDRDCHTTSCPPTATASVIVTSGVTIVAPTATTGSCANGWYLCGAEGGGGCCPLGFACAGASCSAATATQAKETPTANVGIAVAVGSVAEGLLLGAGAMAVANLFV